MAGVLHGEMGGLVSGVEGEGAGWEFGGRGSGGDGRVWRLRGQWGGMRLVL